MMQMENEERLEEQIRMLRKDKNKERASHQRRDPCPKRQRLSGEEKSSQLGGVRRDWLIPEAEKRKQELHEEGVKPPKRMKRGDIRYFMQAEPECSAEAEVDSTSRNIQAEQVLGQAEQVLDSLIRSGRQEEHPSVLGRQ